MTEPTTVLMDQEPRPTRPLFRFLLLAGGSLAVVLVIIIIIVSGGTTSTGAGTVNLQPSVPLKSGSVKTTSAVPVYQQMVKSRFFLPSIVGLVVLAVLVVTIYFMLKQDTQPVGSGTQEQTIEDSSESESWFSPNIIKLAVISTVSIILITLLSVLLVRHLRLRAATSKRGQKILTDAAARLTSLEDDLQMRPKSTLGADSEGGVPTKLPSKVETGKVVDYADESDIVGFDDNEGRLVYAKATESYDALDGTQLSVTKDRVYLMKNADEYGNWYYLHEKGTGKEGWVPSNVLSTKIGGLPVQWEQSYKYTAGDFRAPPEDLQLLESRSVKVIQDYTDPSGKDLNVTKGEEFRLIETWHHVKNLQGGVGWVPGACIEFFEEEPVVTCDYNAQRDVELTIAVGEKVTVEFTLCLVRSADGSKQGWVPAEHLECI